MSIGPLVLRWAFYRPWWRPWLVLELGRIERGANRWAWNLVIGCSLYRSRRWRLEWRGPDDFDVGPFYARSLAALRRRRFAW